MVSATFFIIYFKALCYKNVTAYSQWVNFRSLFCLEGGKIGLVSISPTEFWQLTSICVGIQSPLRKFSQFLISAGHVRPPVASETKTSPQMKFRGHFTISNSR